MKPKRFGLRRIWVRDCYGGRRSVPWAYWLWLLFLRWGCLFLRWGCRASRVRGCEHFVCRYPGSASVTRPISFQRAQELNAKFGGEILYDPDQDFQP